MRMTAQRLALLIVGFHLVAAVIAVLVNLPAQFTTGGEPESDVGWDVLVSGSAISAPLPPLVALGIGAWLAGRGGRSRTVGLVVLLLVCVVTSVGWAGEYASGIPFTGGRYATFLVFSVVGIVLTAALLVQVTRELLQRQHAAVSRPE